MGACMYEVVIKRKIERGLHKLPPGVVQRFRALVNLLRVKGPALPELPNYSKLGDDTYHCHLGYHHAACWRNVNGTITIEVYYVGSREGAPY